MVAAGETWCLGTSVLDGVVLLRAGCHGTELALDWTGQAAVDTVGGRRREEQGPICMLLWSGKSILCNFDRE